MAKLKTKYKWIRFEKAGNQWECINTSEETLGHIEYENGWRQFVYIPWDGAHGNIMYNFRCLEDIADFLKQLNNTKGCYKGKGGRG